MGRCAPDWIEMVIVTRLVYQLHEAWMWMSERPRIAYVFEATSVEVGLVALSHKDPVIGLYSST